MVKISSTTIKIICRQAPVKCCNPFVTGDDFKFQRCQNLGTKKCSGCSGTKPATVYCSVECQKKDWPFHKKHCRKIAYRFRLKLVGSSNPVITRIFDVPSWYTFRELHCAIQYVMGTWDCIHPHEFTFEAPRPGQRHKSSSRDVVFKIGGASLDGDDWSILEQNLAMREVFEDTGRLRSTVSPLGEVLPLYYLYDFNDKWVHELIFKGEKLAHSDRPIIKKATGCAPIELCGGVEGWEMVKKEYGSRIPTMEQEHMKVWARRASGLGEQFSPFNEPDVTVMNYEGRWENHFRHFMEVSKKNDSEHPDLDDTFMSW